MRNVLRKTNTMYDYSNMKNKSKASSYLDGTYAGMMSKKMEGGGSGRPGNQPQASDSTKGRGGQESPFRKFLSKPTV